MITTNRELLRCYKALKDRLLNGEVEHIDVPQKDGMTIRLTLIKDDTPFGKLIEKVKNKPFKNLERPSDDLI